MNPRERLEAAPVGPEPMTRIVYADDLDGVLAALKQLEVPMGELKPCPFCGQDAKVYGDSDVGFCVVCLGQDIPGNKCFAAMGENYDPYAMPEHVYRTEAEAVAAWNRRVEPEGERTYTAGQIREMVERVRRDDSNTMRNTAMWVAGYSAALDALLAQLPEAT